MTFAVHGPALGRSAECGPILLALPDWFGIPAAVERYVAEIDALPTYVARDDAGRAVGFLTLTRPSPTSAEVHVMAVRPEAHRRGVGRALLARAEADAIADGVRALLVRTLGPSHPDAGYAATRAFYAAVGFVAVEESTEPWGPENPCLLMAKPIGPDA